MRINVDIIFLVFCMLRPLWGEPCVYPYRISRESIGSHFCKPAQQPKVGTLVQFLSLDNSAGAEHQKTRSFWHTSGLRGISSDVSAWQCAVLNAYTYCNQYFYGFSSSVTSQVCIASSPHIKIHAFWKQRGRGPRKGQV